MRTLQIFLHPGLVCSKSDGEWHYVDEWRLAGLYGVPMAACKVVPFEDSTKAPSPTFFIDGPLDIHLRPRWDGRYGKIPFSKGH